MLINLVPHGQRTGSIDATMARLAERTRDVPGIALYTQPVQELTIEDRVSRTQYQFTLTSPDTELLAEWNDKLLQHLRTLPELQDITSDLQQQGQQAYVDVDRDAAARLGVSMAAIDDALYSAYG